MQLLNVNTALAADVYLLLPRTEQDIVMKEVIQSLRNEGYEPRAVISRSKLPSHYFWRLSTGERVRRAESLMNGVAYVCHAKSKSSLDHHISNSHQEFFVSRRRTRTTMASRRIGKTTSSGVQVSEVAKARNRSSTQAFIGRPTTSCNGRYKPYTCVASLLKVGKSHASHNQEMNWLLRSLSFDLSFFF